MDGAMLGAEQVQDKQLELAMEEAKKVSAEEVFATFLFILRLRRRSRPGSSAPPTGPSSPPF
jgi:hypothetical protein